MVGVDVSCRTPLPSEFMMNSLEMAVYRLLAKTICASIRRNIRALVVARVSRKRACLD